MIVFLITNLPVRYLTNEQAKAFQSPRFLEHSIISSQAYLFFLSFPFTIDLAQAQVIFHFLLINFPVVS